MLRVLLRNELMTAREFGELRQRVRFFTGFAVKVCRWFVKGNSSGTHMLCALHCTRGNG